MSQSHPRIGRTDQTRARCKVSRLTLLLTGVPSPGYRRTVPAGAIAGARRAFAAHPTIMSIPSFLRIICSLAMVMALLAAPVPSGGVPSASAADSIGSPFSDGLAVRIIQGYNGGTHQGRSRYGLDLVLADGGTSGATVLAPISGAVSWAQGPGASNGCVAIALPDGSHSVVLCHVILDRAYRPGESVARGQQLGTVGAAGSVGNNGAPHVHLELHRGRGANNPVPFSVPDGLPLQGVELPTTGGAGEHGGRTPVVASVPAAGRSATAAPGAGQSAGTVVAQGQAAPRPLVLAPSTTDGARAPRSVQAPGLLRAAIVQGTGSCLNVREKAAADARIVECLPEGAEVPLVAAARGADGSWSQIESKGWAASQFLKRTRAVIAGTDGCLNVRERPTLSAPTVGCLAEGAAVQISDGPMVSDGLDWYRIEPATPLNKGGWVAGKYLD